MRLAYPGQPRGQLCAKVDEQNDRYRSYLAFIIIRDKLNVDPVIR